MRCGGSARQFYRRLAEQSRIIKLPLNRVGTIHKIGKAQAGSEQEYSTSKKLRAS